MAAGYARSRPPVHRRVLDLALQRLGRTAPFPVALDLGCGAGVSTAALNGLAARCIGLEPNVSMLRWAADVAPGAQFVAGSAEAIPLRAHTVDLITAAGSLNYTDPAASFAEASRVLAPGGVLIVYDFGPGRTPDDWLAEFLRRYPPPPNEARELNPAILAQLASGFTVTCAEPFEIALPMSRAFYIDYMMTETNVAAAVRGGTPQTEIREWCDATLTDACEQVVFRGYFTCLRATPC
jgi:SAM-dependent methyltransferase